MAASPHYYSVTTPPGPTMTSTRLTNAPKNRLSLAVFLPSMEVSIVATSLLAITNELQGFDQSSWIVTSYMLTYTGEYDPISLGTERLTIVEAS